MVSITPLVLRASVVIVAMGMALPVAAQPQDPAVTLVPSTGTVACKRGTSWGFDEKSLRARDGCSAEFSFGTKPAGGQGHQPPAQATTDGSAWSFSASAYTYVVPDSQNYVQPTLTADRGSFHLEARYNYEGLHTGSAWVGYNFNGGKKLTWEFTPIVGGVFGDTQGIAPGFKGSLNWWKLELYGEGEYLIDTGDSSNSFAYEWSEFSLAPAGWWRFGMVTQRTRVYKSDRTVQRGVLAGVSLKRVKLTAYFFNPDTDKPSFVFGVVVPF